jgi:hypothetical protein
VALSEPTGVRRILKGCVVLWRVILEGQKAVRLENHIVYTAMKFLYHGYHILLAVSSCLKNICVEHKAWYEGWNTD